MTRIRIDLNAVRGDGLTRARRTNADGEIRAGMMLTAYEPEDRIAMPAYVERAEEGNAYVFLRVNRAAAQDDLTPELYMALHAVLNGHAASNPALLGAITASNDSGSDWETDHEAIVSTFTPREVPLTA